MKTVWSIIKNENRLLSLKKKSEISFFEYHILGLLSFFTSKGHDYFIITDRRIVYLIKDKLIKHGEYQSFESIQFNSNNNNLSFKNLKGQTEIINLNKFRPSYEEIQIIKQKLHPSTTASKTLKS
ncbi:hypothetical protein [Winogradskyella arenosi]|uniref:PH (Pleckstrin Homology) domain-containing protein n=1 Tax=Winogradskyella arenosi TaxID=533325 RepID=A0A368ZCF8_9FLAO|nr:hypothetical protein [Winogradskyella arenosi]RCW90177.1 hypothetical protein DFQ08_10566 [Winogradskyella arenosi]